MTGDRAVALSHGGPLVRVRFGVGSRHRESYEATGEPWPEPIPMVALIDTGSDLCVVKEGVFSRLGVKALVRRTVTTLGFRRREVFSYLGGFTFEEDIEVPGVAIEGLPGDLKFDCILGREVLRYGQMNYRGRDGVVDLSIHGRPVRMIERPESFA